MKPCLYTRADLARDLRALHAMAVTDEQTLRAWYADAGRVRDQIYEHGVSEPLAQEDLRFVMQYLLEAHLRLEDPKLAAAHAERLSALLSELDR